MGHGTSGSNKGWKWGIPPGCGQTHTCENSTLPILRMRAVIMANARILSQSHLFHNIIYDLVVVSMNDNQFTYYVGKYFV